jgi:hypothetical protein
MSVIDAINLRLDRAYEHLVEIERLIDTYTSGEPYAVRPEFERRPRVYVYRLRHIEEPDPKIAVVIGDLLHNLRAAMNYCMGGLVPSRRAAKTQFPILAVDPFARERPGGRYLQRQPDTRRAWRSWVKGVHPDALAIIERLQPYHPGPRGTPRYLAVLNALNNGDKHRRLTVVSGGAVNVSVKAYALDGTLLTDRTPVGNTLLQDGTELFRHPTEVQVHVRLTAHVGIRLGQDGVHMAVHGLPKLAVYVRDGVIAPLEPYLRR